MAVKIMGILLIAAGIAGLLYGKFSYTKKDSRSQVGPPRAVGCGKTDGQRPSAGRRGDNPERCGGLLLYGSRKR